MTKLEEIMLEIEGKIQYAKSTGNAKAETELRRIKVYLEDLNEVDVKTSLCKKCRKDGELGSCFAKPQLVIQQKVIRCPMFKEQINEI